ncbi:DNA polymerase [Sphingomonas sp. Leaf407]|uniref:UdgX family uracil-DNA binding protein n=1 Tax=unclassified Sphingomonas TaxID=196159 RepID=UPI0006F22ED2|nr:MULTISPECIES: UdgX family uracil-DNA binding protein [unclassified Sphingomonas]KQN36564.1 DNA polymerase [Sphingomonas sp. Leaf42]KQT27186.1 DNA polymerase [Sphingomonas sp. Leaf407]
MRVAALASADDFDGWRDAARRLIAERVPPHDVVWQIGDLPTDLFGDEAITADPAPFRVPRAFVDLAGTAILHAAPERFALLYAMLVRLVAEPRLIDDRADPAMRRLEEMAKAVRRDIHKMRAFLRFREIADDDGPRFVAWFEPEHHIVRHNARFFVDRFAVMHWSILTPELSLHWDGKALAEGPGATRADAPDGDPVEEVWKTYYASIFNPARLKKGAMLKEMPRKYWKNMPETALVPALIAGAQAREAAMIKTARTAPQDNVLPAWEALRDEATACTRCPLWKPATQTVFGEGPADAELMIVGEQPGDQEDLAGHPFVGPAGQLFDRAMAAAGLDRSRVYLTNAVKHFKFEQRGKRRIHAKPGVGEIDACRWWIEQERAIVRPKMTIAMGATAARSLTGKAVTIGRERSRPLTLPDGGTGWITVHPSYLLRLPDPAAAEIEFGKFVEDLRNAAAGV